MPRTLAHHAHIPLGAILIVLGVWTFSDPTVLRHYGIDTSEPNARIALSAIIGGGEIGLGFVLVVGSILKFDRSTLNLVAASVFISVGACRISAALMEHSALFGIQPFREGAIELMLGVIALLGVFLRDQNNNFDLPKVNAEQIDKVDAES